jgi:hypothetical protein
MGVEIQANQAETMITNGVVEQPHEVSLTRAAAAGSLVLSAALLMAGKRRSAVAAAVAAGAIVALEKPEVLQRIWESVPGYLRRGQEFLEKVEGVVSEISTQGEKLRERLHKD